MQALGKKYGQLLFTRGSCIMHQNAPHTGALSLCDTLLSGKDLQRWLVCLWSLGCKPSVMSLDFLSLGFTGGARGRERRRQEIYFRSIQTAEVLRFREQSKCNRQSLKCEYRPTKSHQVSSPSKTIQKIETKLIVCTRRTRQIHGDLQRLYGFLAESERQPAVDTLDIAV